MNIRNLSLSVALVAVYAIGYIGCAALRSEVDRQPAQCSPARLAEIEAAYVAEVVKVCEAEHASNTADCAAFPAIADKYAAKRAAYVACAPEGAAGAGGAK